MTSKLVGNIIVLSQKPKKDIYNGLWIDYKRPKEPATNLSCCNINKGQTRYPLPANMNPRDIRRIFFKLNK